LTLPFLDKIIMLFFVDGFLPFFFNFSCGFFSPSDPDFQARFFLSGLELPFARR